MEQNKCKIDVPLSEEHGINHRVRQGCALSPTVFNKCMSKIILKWSQIY
jgi:hypothetical protein